MFDLCLDVSMSSSETCLIEGAEIEDDDGAAQSSSDLVFGSGYPSDPRCVEW